MKKVAERSALILDTALHLAEQQPWENVRLHDVAAALDCTLDEIRRCYPQKEDLIDAWFDRADQAMLQDAAHTDFNQLAPLERIERVMMSWILALAPHQRVTRQMILGRLEPGHLHIQIAALMRVSRTVQWMREAAQRKATYLNRALEESLLTSLYLATFAQWLVDDSQDFEKTRQRLHRRLHRLNLVLHLTEGEHTEPQAYRVPPAEAKSRRTHTHH
ncbi:MAG TPA: hypothetical protein VIS52_00880 [Motiliproteus sp.]